MVLQFLQLHHQVLQFESCAVEILRNKGVKIENLARFFDTCSGQFRSQYCNWDLKQKKTILNIPGNVKHHYFEPNEGKNLSDTIGALAKQAFKRGMIKNYIGISTIGDIVKLIQENLKTETQNCSNCNAFVEGWGKMGKKCK